MARSPYDIDYDKLLESQEVTDPVMLLKLELGAKFCKITKKMETGEILDMTGLDKSDLSRIKVGSVKRFSLDRMVGLLSSLGYRAKVKVVPENKAAS